MNRWTSSASLPTVEYPLCGKQLFKFHYTLAFFIGSSFLCESSWQQIVAGWLSVVLLYLEDFSGVPESHPINTNSEW